MLRILTRRRAIHSEGRGAAAEVDAWLSEGITRLPFDGSIKKRVRSVFRLCLTLLMDVCRFSCLRRAICLKSRTVPSR